MIERKDQYFNDLLGKYFGNSCTKDELRELVEWVNDNPGTLKDMLRLHWNHRSEISVDSQSVFDSIMMEAREIESDNKGSFTKPPMVRRMYAVRKNWLSAAAVILFLLVGGGIWYFIANRQSATGNMTGAVDQPVSDVQPGGNKAILTLADGTEVVLDSAGNGDITREGNVSIVKLDDGQLAYESLTANIQPSTVLYNTITTPRGGQYQLTLEDGTKVWLNAESSLRYPTSFVGDRRKVQLTGEGYFEVARNEKMPFYVEAGDVDVKVLGTHFNINAYSDEDAIRTTLLEGKVEVANRGKSVVLNPGEQARFRVSDNELRTTGNVDVDAVMAWKNGLFYFDEADIQDVMRKLSKWYDVDVIYQGKTPERVFGGEMQRSLTLTQVLKLLGINKIKYEIVGKTLIIKS